MMKYRQDRGVVVAGKQAAVDIARDAYQTAFNVDPKSDNLADLLAAQNQATQELDKATMAFNDPAIAP